jgi:hypothetical protein
MSTKSCLPKRSSLASPFGKMNTPYIWLRIRMPNFGFFSIMYYCNIQSRLLSMKTFGKEFWREIPLALPTTHWDIRGMRYRLFTVAKSRISLAKVCRPQWPFVRYCTCTRDPRINFEAS